MSPVSFTSHSLIGRCNHTPSFVDQIGGENVLPDMWNSIKASGIKDSLVVSPEQVQLPVCMCVCVGGGGGGGECACACIGLWRNFGLGLICLDKCSWSAHIGIIYGYEQWKQCKVQ